MTAEGPGPDADRPAVPTDETGTLRFVARALVRAATMLMIFKAFVADASVVCTRSMEPTIVGRDKGGDVVLVDKAIYRVSAPGRYDVVFFRYANNREVTYLKRVVGLPGEHIALLGGDLWILDPGDDSPVEAAALAGRAHRIFRPAVLERRDFALRPVVLPGEEGLFGRLAFDRLFECAPLVRARFAEAPGGGMICTPEADEEVLATFARSVTDYLPDAVDLRAGSLAPKAGTGGRIVVGDVAFGFEIRLEETGTAVLELDDPRSGVRHFARFDRSGGGLVRLDGPDDGVTAEGAAPELVRDGFTAVRFERIDGRLRAFVDGRLVVSADTPYRAGRADARGLVAFGAAKGGATFRKPRLERDLHYLEDGQIRWNVPPDAYLCLGDHPADSSDARHWRVAVIEDLRSGLILEGDADGMRSGSLQNGGRNPYRTEDGVDVFVDRFDRPRRFASEDEWRRLGEYRTPYVLRSAIFGKAACVVWPPVRAGVVR